MISSSGKLSFAVADEEIYPACILCEAESSTQESVILTLLVRADAKFTNLRFSLTHKRRRTYINILSDVFSS